ncbi:hypothetical protein B0H19DRAFT_106566 [Mycena capillaripes]|nr:hypothetical protein B0H19DRAFT_106566 [Mycena capillaripes]
MVTTRRIYEAARTGRRVRAWRTEVGALEVGYSESDEVVASGDSPDFLMGEEERGTQGAGEGKKRLARAGTVDEVRGGKKHEHEHEHKAGGEKNKNPKHSSLPLPLVPLRLGSLSLLARVKQAQPTAQGENKGKGKDKTPTTTTTTKRRTTVVRARAVSVAVRPDAGATPAPGLAVPREHHGQEEQEEAHKGREEGYGDGVGEGEDGQSGKGAIPASWLGEEDDAEWRACESPEPIWVCTDFSCREAGHRHEWEGEDEEKAEVDQQISWEDASGGSMTRELVRILDRDPHPTLRSLLTKVSDAFPRMSLEWQLETLRYKRDLKRYNKLVLERNATAAGSATRDADAYSQTTERQMPHQPRQALKWPVPHP